MTTGSATGKEARPAQSSVVAYVDSVDGTTYPLDVPRWRSDAGRPLMITPLPGIGRHTIDRGRRSLWRYGASLPIAVADPVSLGEGLTPLVERRWHGAPVLFKLEWFSPSGSFKDRGASVMISLLRQQGIAQVLEDSSGNGGAAVAAYAAAAGLGAKILVPASTQPGKTVQMRIYGAEVELVPGTRQETAEEAVRQAERIFYASHNWQAFFLQGTKTLAYELWEDLGFRAPDNVIVPLGAGSNVLGCDIGFGELLRCGEIARLPRLFGAQPENCAPIHASFITSRPLRRANLRDRRGRVRHARRLRHNWGSREDRRRPNRNGAQGDAARGRAARGAALRREAAAFDWVGTRDGPPDGRPAYPTRAAPASSRLRGSGASDHVWALRPGPRWPASARATLFSPRARAGCSILGCLAKSRAPTSPHGTKPEWAHRA